MMKQKWYDALKYVQRIGLPAAIVLFSTLAAIWNWPYREAITASLAAVDAFLGAILMIDSNNYFKDKAIMSIPLIEGETIYFDELNNQEEEKND